MGLFKKKIDPQKIVDSAIGGIDKAFFTNQEKANAAFKIVEAQAEFVKSALNGSTVSSLTRRYIAVSIVGAFLLLLLFAAAVYKIDVEWGKFSLDLAGRLSNLALMVAAFYFGGYMVSNHFLKGFNKVKEKKNDNGKT